MKRLNIFVDETGDFGFVKKSSELYGVSFTFHEQEKDITNEINILNNRLEKIGYSDMIHMADLVMKRGDYSRYSINMRKNIFKIIYHFSRKATINYKTIIVDKKYTNNISVLKRKLFLEISKMVKDKEEYFNKFDKIVMYYDDGQEGLTNILNSVFYRFNGFEQRSNFNHREKRLFQVSDMLTYIDKYDYKYRNKYLFTKSERYFFSDDEIRKIIRELNKKRF